MEKSPRFDARSTIDCAAVEIVVSAMLRNSGRSPPVMRKFASVRLARCAGRSGIDEEQLEPALPEQPVALVDGERRVLRGLGGVELGRIEVADLEEVDAVQVGPGLEGGAAGIAAAEIAQSRHRHLAMVAVRVSPVRRTT